MTNTISPASPEETTVSQSQPGYDGERAASVGSEPSAKEALFYLRLAADQLENLAFSMPPPNSWTPRFVMLANSIRHEWALLSERALRAPAASPEETEWVLVPREPSFEMVSRGGAAIWDTASEDRHALIASAYRAMLRASPPTPLDGWRSIETAPRDGAHVLIGTIGTTWTGEAYYREDDRSSDEGWWWAQTNPGDYTAERITPDPTHWMPLPEPPSPLGGQSLGGGGGEQIQGSSSVQSEPPSGLAHKAEG